MSKLRESNPLEYLLCLVWVARRSLAAAETDSHLHVGYYGQGPERLGNLMSSDNSGLRRGEGFRPGQATALKQNLSGSGPEGAGNDAQKRRFAGPIGANQPVNSALLQLETHFFQRGEP